MAYSLGDFYFDLLQASKLLKYPCVLFVLVGHIIPRRFHRILHLWYPFRRHIFAHRFLYLRSEDCIPRPVDSSDKAVQCEVLMCRSLGHLLRIGRVSPCEHALLREALTIPADADEESGGGYNVNESLTFCPAASPL